MSVAVGTRPRIHRAWWVALGVLAAGVAAAGFRSSTGALIEPIEAEFGWNRTTTSGAVSLNLLVYGLTAPFAAALMERFGLRRVLSAALVLVALGSGLTVLVGSPWQLWLLWGLFVGVGTGAMALVMGSIVANRWFVTRRGLVTGFFSAASAAGQLVFLPAFAALTVGPGWRYAALITSAASLLLVPVALFVVADRPQDVGTTPYGTESSTVSHRPPASSAAPTGRAEPHAAAVPFDMDAGPKLPEPRPHLSAVGVLREIRSAPVFWLLAGTFFVCGWSTNGLVGTHFIPAAHDHGMVATTAAGLLALIGVFDIAGTIASGWLTDRVDPRLLLVAYYVLRGLSLLVVPAVLGPQVRPDLFLFIVLYGLDWVATVPPTMALCRRYFGLERSSIVFGWVFASHMVGAGIAAWYAGWVRQSSGDYATAWLTAGALCLAAGLACLRLTSPPPSASA